MTERRKPERIAMRIDKGVSEKSFSIISCDEKQTVQFFTKVKYV